MSQKRVPTFRYQIKHICNFRSVPVPAVECEDMTDKRCVNLPTIQEADLEATACVPVVATPKCDKVSLEIF